MKATTINVISTTYYPKPLLHIYTTGNNGWIQYLYYHKLNKPTIYEDSLASFTMLSNTIINTVCSNLDFYLCFLNFVCYKNIFQYYCVKSEPRMIGNTE